MVKRVAATQNRTPQECPCGGSTYGQCCGRWIDGGEHAATAEQLMRSRYTAYTLGDAAYIARTWAASTRPATLDAAVQSDTKWLGLTLLASSINAPGAEQATVEFVARYKRGGRAQRLHEVSRFVRENGQWFYLDGSFPESRTTT